MERFVKELVRKIKNRIKYNELCYKKFSGAKISGIYEAQINAYKNTIEIVNELAKEYNNGWISCEESLPEESVNVIGWDEKSGRAYFVQYVWNHWVLDHKWQLNTSEELHITHWQPTIPRPHN